jgi:serine/threonine-protein kinase HipA
MHLKNFSLITTRGKVELSPAYDLLNTSIVLRNPKEEMAIPIRGKKRNLTVKDLIEYFCLERCVLPQKVLDSLLEDLKASSKSWPQFIQRSYLGEDMKERYLDLVQNRTQRLFGNSD